MVTAVKEMKADEVKVVTTDDALILVKKLDPMADDENFEKIGNPFSLRQKMKNFWSWSINGRRKRK